MPVSNSSSPPVLNISVAVIPVSPDESVQNRTITEKKNTQSEESLNSSASISTATVTSSTVDLISDSPRYSKCYY